MEELPVFQSEGDVEAPGRANGIGGAFASSRRDGLNTGPGDAEGLETIVQEIRETGLIFQGSVSAEKGFVEAEPRGVRPGTRGRAGHGLEEVEHSLAPIPPDKASIDTYPEGKGHRVGPARGVRVRHRSTRLLGELVLLDIRLVQDHSQFHIQDVVVSSLTSQSPVAPTHLGVASVASIHGGVGELED